MYGFKMFQAKNGKRYRKIDDNQAGAIIDAVCFAAALRSMGGHAVSFEQRKDATNAAIAAYESVAGHIDRANAMYEAERRKSKERTVSVSKSDQTGSVGRYHHDQKRGLDGQRGGYIELD